MASKIHFTHRFSKTEQLILEEYQYEDVHQYHVYYLTHEPMEDEPNTWFVNNTDVYKNFNEAKDGFNKRREAENPFRCITRSY